MRFAHCVLAFVTGIVSGIGIEVIGKQFQLLQAKVCRVRDRDGLLLRHLQSASVQLKGFGRQESDLASILYPQANTNKLAVILPGSRCDVPGSIQVVLPKRDGN